MWTAEGPIDRPWGVTLVFYERAESSREPWFDTMRAASIVDRKMLYQNLDGIYSKVTSTTEEIWTRNPLHAR